MSGRLKQVISIVLAAALLIPSGLFASVAEAATETVTVYHETFENGVGAAAQSGGASLVQVADKVFDGNEDGFALSVSNRANNYDAADFSFTAAGMENSKTYTITVKGYVDAGVEVPAGAQAFLQTIESYGFVGAANFVAGEAFTLTGQYTVGSVAADTKFRVQSNDDGASVPFYIGDVLVTTERTAETPAGELVLKEGFENGQGSWTGNGATAAVIESDSHEGERSLLITGRAQNYHGPSLVLTDTLEKGATYQITGYVKLAAEAEEGAQIKISMEQTGDKITDSNEKWRQVAGYQTVTKDAWTLVSGSYIYNPDATAIKLYFESDSPTVGFALDAFTIYRTAAAPGGGGGGDDFVPVTIGDYNFDDGKLQGWGPRGSAIVEAVTEESQSGTHSLKITGRTQEWQGVSLDLKGVIEKNAKYLITGYVRLVEGEPGSNMKFTVEQVNGSSYQQVNNPVPVTDAEWVKLEGAYSFDTDHPLLNLYVESDQLNAFYLDSITIVMTEPAPAGEAPPRDPALPFTTITFEDDTTGGFVGRSGTEILEVTDEANHTEGGTKALRVTNRTANWHGPSLRVEKYVDQGYEYTVSAWVKLISPEAGAQLSLSTQVGNGNTASYNNILRKTITTAEGWSLFEGKYRYNSVGGEYLTIYVEGPVDATFYIDDISFVRGSAPIEVQKDLTPIKAQYQDDFLIGNAISMADLSGPRLELLKHHHNVVTAENAMKPDATQPTKGNFTWSDTLVDTARAEGLQVFGHVLVWHAQTPTWMNMTADEQPLSREEALANMREHVQTVVEHYGERVIGWDVVNEAMNDGPPNPTDWQNALRRSAWYHSIGPDFVEQAFLAAKEVIVENNWDVKLYYNDYNDDNQNKATAIYSMIKDINERYAAAHDGDLLIDGVGMQAHYNLTTNPENVRMSLERFLTLEGLEVSVTELDIMAGADNVQTDRQKAQQGYLYAQLFKIYKEHADRIARVTFWGLNDATSWRAVNSPLLFDGNLQAKNSYYAVIDPDKYIEENPPETQEALQSAAIFGTPTIDGTVDAMWDQAPAMAVNRYQTAWQGAAGTAKALWDYENLYVLVRVNDAQLDKASANPWEQDSIEIFLDQNNAKTSFYQADDGQYRVNYDNEVTAGSTGLAPGFESATKVDGTSYTVEVKIPLTTVTPAVGGGLGFDVQINDARAGARISAAAWNDMTGTGYQDTSVFGVLELKDTASFTVMTSSESIALGEEVTLTLHAPEVTGVYGLGATIDYDETRFEFVDATIGEAFGDNAVFIKDIRNIANGELKLVGTLTGNSDGISGEAALVKVRFRTIKGGEGSFLVKSGSELEAGGKVISLKQDLQTKFYVVTEDTTGNGKLELDDVTSVARAFGTSKGDAGFDWRYDFNGDQKIDLADLNFAARAYLDR